MHKKRSKKAEFFRILSLFTIFPLTILVLVSVSVLYILGYRLDLGTHQVSQGGMVQFNSAPSGAMVSLDGRVLSGRTGTKLDTSSGTHSVVMSLGDKYYDWQKTVTVDPGMILWLNYARFIPKNIETRKTLSYPAVSSALSLQAKSQLYVMPSAMSAKFFVVKAGNDTATQIEVTIPQTTYTKPKSTSRFSLSQVDASGRYVIIKHIYDGAKTEWLYVDVDDPGRSINLSSLVQMPLSSIEFDGKNARALNILVDGEFRRLSIDNKSISSAIVDTVDYMYTNGDGIVSYTTLPDSKTGQRTVGYVSRGATIPKIVRTFARSMESVRFYIIHYATKRYFVFQHSTTLEVKTSDNLPTSNSHDQLLLDNVAVVSLSSATSTVSFSPTQRFIIIQNGVTFQTYDLELEKLTTTTQRGDGAASSLVWIDDSMLVSVRGGDLESYEFDGENNHALLQKTMSPHVVLSPNEQYLYAFQSEADKTIGLEQLRLIVD